MSVRVTLDTRTRPIRIGETVFGQVITGTHVGVTVISDQALVPFEEGFRIFVVDSSNVAHARNITIGGRSGRRVWVTDGVTRGETVVTVGAYGLDDGATVVRVDAKSQAIP